MLFVAVHEFGFGTNSDEPIIAGYVRSLGWCGLSTDDASWAVHDPKRT